MEKPRKAQCEVCGEVAELDENDVCAYCYPIVSDESLMMELFAEAV